MMTSDDNKAVRKVLNLLTDIQDELTDALAALGGEDVVAAKMSLAHVARGAEQAIEALTPKETRSGTQSPDGD